MGSLTNFHLYFPDSSVTLPDLGEYFKLLNAFYDAYRADEYKAEMTELPVASDTRQPTGDPDPEIIDLSFEDLFYGSPQIMTGLAQDAIRYHQLAMTDHAGEAIRLHAIRMNSPMKIGLTASAIALSFAVILSGGEIDFSAKSLKVSLPPIATGILALRQALGYGIHAPPSRDAPGALSEEMLQGKRAATEPSPARPRLKTKRIRPQAQENGPAGDPW
jgi:hypothetical protein